MKANNTFYTLRGFVLGFFFASSSAFGQLAPLSDEVKQVTVSGQVYDVQYFLVDSNANRFTDARYSGYFSSAYMPWYGNSSLANDFAVQTGYFTNLNWNGGGALFSFMGDSSWQKQSAGNTGNVTGFSMPNPFGAPIQIAVASASVPEIDGKLLPQVLLLLTGLFFLFRGRFGRQTAGQATLEDRRLCVA